MEEKEILEKQTNEENIQSETEKNSEVESLLAQIAGLNDKYLRLAAELENTRRRAALDAESTARNRALAIMQSFLPVMDAVDAAVSHEPNDAGIISISKTLVSALAKIGITKIETVGQVMNPQFHNVLQVVEKQLSDCPCSAKPIPNEIVGELQSGYMFGDTVLRPASVVVQK